MNEDIEVNDIITVKGFEYPQAVCHKHYNYVVFIDTVTGDQACAKYEDVKEIGMKPSEKQVAGNHYSKLKIQPMQYSLANNLNYAQANAIKYITRYKYKNGVEDLKKAIHCLELLIEFEQSELVCPLIEARETEHSRMSTKLNKFNSCFDGVR